MKHLSVLDALFLQFETADTPMHVGSLMLLERPRGRRHPYRAIREHVASRMHLGRCAAISRRDRAALAKAMIAAVPVSLRAPGDTSQANFVSMMLVGLATDVADPVARMHAIRPASTRAKTLTGSMKGAIPTDMPSLAIPWLMAGITPLFRKAAAANRIPVVANVAISNVPGPQMPLYLAGANCAPTSRSQS
jgi:hypothetical protein